MDTRHTEFIAMIISFFGEDFRNRPEVVKVGELQLALHTKQEELCQKLEGGQLDDESYVDAFNSLLFATFAECENVLGKEDFEKLFGTSRDKLAGFIDKETFLASRKGL